MSDSIYRPPPPPPGTEEYPGQIADLKRELRKEAQKCEHLRRSNEHLQRELRAARAERDGLAGQGDLGLEQDYDPWDRHEVGPDDVERELEESKT